MSGKEKRFFTVDFVMVLGHSRENVTRFVLKTTAHAFIGFLRFFKKIEPKVSC